MQDDESLRRDEEAAATLAIADMSKDERSFLLYAETCCVDGGGILIGVRMNEEDLAAGRRFQELGLMIFGRIPASLIGVRCEGLYWPNGATHYVELTDAGWELAHSLRRLRAQQRSPYAVAVFEHELVLERRDRAA